MKRFITAWAALLVMLAMTAAAGAGVRAGSDGGTATPTVDTGSALVQLNGEPLATYSKTKPPRGKKIDFDSNTVRSYRAQLAALRNDFKEWLRANAPHAKVTGEFDITLHAVGVKLNGTPLGTIAGAPLVRRAELQGLYRPLGHEDPDLALVSALQAWSAAGGTSTAKGAGVRVAIIDSGIDVTHPCFSDAGYSTQSKEGDPALTNDKVVVAKVFDMQTPSRGWTPADLNGHGTHVAGTVACNEHTAASVGGVTIPYEPSGVAPRALLGNYNVFPGEEGSGRSEDILDALEEAIEDGFDVANMSLGGGSSGIQDLLSMGVDNADAANVVVAVAAGNEGPGAMTTGSPGIAPRALTAGGLTVGHFVAASVLSGGATVPAVAGEFATVSADLTKPLAVVTSGDVSPVTGLAQACSALPAGSLSGKIALISRGSCTFSQKIRNAQNAGAAAALVMNNAGGDASAMGRGGIANEPTIPAYMVSLADGTTLKGKNGVSTTITAAKAYFRTTNDNLRYSSSSVGPTDVDFRVKPDVTAPAVNVLSSQPAWACAAGTSTGCWEFFQGTSMATPHLAGIAALLRAQHPSWTSSEVRSAIVNTADQDVIKNTNGVGLATSVQQIGSGRANAEAASKAKVALDPVSVSFGAVPSGAGQSASKTVQLTTLSGSGPYSVAIKNAAGAKGVMWAASVSGNTVTVSMSASKGIANGARQAILQVRDSTGAEIAHAALYVLVK